MYVGGEVAQVDMVIATGATAVVTDLHHSAADRCSFPTWFR